MLSDKNIDLIISDLISAAAGDDDADQRFKKAKQLFNIFIIILEFCLTLFIFFYTYIIWPAEKNHRTPFYFT